MTLGPIPLGQPTCRVCAKPLVHPWYRTDDMGHIIEGCIAEDHASHIHLNANKTLVEWYFRKEAKEYRKQEHERRRSIINE